MFSSKESALKDWNTNPEWNFAKNQKSKVSILQKRRKFIIVVGQSMIDLYRDDLDWNEVQQLKEEIS